jgi:FMN phosphatase YigB (HAD superfamily)
MNVALEKTIQEFKMWGAMSRKPGQPAEYLGQIYGNVLAEQKLASVPGERYPELVSERLWEAIIKKLLQKDYQFDAGFFGSLNEFCRKVAYFFHASLQGIAGYPGLAQALKHVAASGLEQGLLADGQCFTPAQLQRGLGRQLGSATLDGLVNSRLVALSHEVRGRKPSERLFRQVLTELTGRGLTPSQVLHIGSSIPRDLAPAKRVGMRTGLFAGDRASLQATGDQLRGQATRPDILLTELAQVAEVVGDP